MSRSKQSLNSGARSQEPGVRHSSLLPPPSSLPFHSALSTQHSALSTQHSALLRAFTILELLVSIGILGILVALLFQTFKSTSDVTLRNQNRVEVNQVVRAVMDLITRDLERAVYTGSAVNMYQGASGSWIANQIPTN